MKIGILGGTGRMGLGLGRTYSAAGHTVILGGRNPTRAHDAALALPASVQGGSLAEAAQAGELIVLAVPFAAAIDTVQPLQEHLGEKIIVDITNPFGAVPPGQISGIEHNRDAAPSARWVAAYKTTFWKTLESPANSDGLIRDVFVSAEDADAKKVVMELIDSTGFRPIDCAGFENARTLDLMVPLMIDLDSRYQMDANSSWKFLG